MLSVGQSERRTGRGQLPLARSNCQHFKKEQTVTQLRKELLDHHPNHHPTHRRKAGAEGPSGPSCGAACGPSRRKQGRRPRRQRHSVPGTIKFIICHCKQNGRRRIFPRHGKLPCAERENYLVVFLVDSGLFFLEGRHYGNKRGPCLFGSCRFCCWARYGRLKQVFN